jgi:RNA polymerase sigma factor (sigma-70 family)
MTGTEGERSRTSILLESACTGDVEAQSRLFERFEPRLRGWIRKELGPQRFESEGEELIQVISLAFVKALPKVRHRSRKAFHALMRTVVRNKVIDWHKAARRRKRSPGGIRQRLLSTVLTQAAAESPTPSQIVVSREERERLWSAIDSVPKRYRAVLRYILAESPESHELAQFLEKPPEAARKFAGRAIAHLARVLQTGGIP